MVTCLCHLLLLLVVSFWATFWRHVGSLFVDFGVAFGPLFGELHMHISPSKNHHKNCDIWVACVGVDATLMATVRLAVLSLLSDCGVGVFGDCL